MAPRTQALQSEGLCLYAVQLLSIRAADEHNRHLKLKMLLSWKSSLVLNMAADNSASDLGRAILSEAFI